MKPNITTRIASAGLSLILSLTALSVFPAAAETAVPEPVFSQESGFYAAAFDLSLTAPDGCTVYYTLDGTDPTADSPQYESPIAIYDRTPESNVIAQLARQNRTSDKAFDKAMIVRAAAADAEGNLSETVTKTYFIGYADDDYLREIPVISLVTAPDNLFDEQIGIYSDSYSDSPDSDGLPNYFQRGRAWERPASITLFEQGKAVYSANVGIGIHGNSSSMGLQKSFKVYSRKEYGTKKLKYDFFHGAAKDADGSSITEFNHMILRNGGNDENLKLRDRLAQEMSAGRSFGTQTMTECVVFIDGEFWGLYNITEKLNESYAAAHYHVKKDSVTLIKDSLDFLDPDAKGRDDFIALVTLAGFGLSGADAYDRAAAVVDLNSFAEYMAAQLIIANTDFNDNNFALWKTDTVDSSNPYADGRWRFLMYDTDFTQYFSDDDLDMFEWTDDAYSWNYQLLYGLLQNSAQFRVEFAHAYLTLCDENFNADRVQSRLDELWQVYRAPLAETYERFSGIFMGFDPADDLAAEYTELRGFWDKRADHARTHLIEHLQKYVTPGDVNGDAQVDAADAALLQSWLLGDANAAFREWFAGDLNADGRLDALDLTLLKQMLV